ATVSRNAAAHIALPSENEWYKAAYYDGATSSFFKYPTSSNTLPTSTAPPGGPNSANFDNVVGKPSDVGAYTLSGSPYHTFDQGGNVNQWLETVLDDGMSRVIRGGSNASVGGGDLASTGRHTFAPGGTRSDIGFRLTMVPEPSTALLALLAAALLAVYRTR